MQKIYLSTFIFIFLISGLSAEIDVNSKAFKEQIQEYIIEGKKLDSAARFRFCDIILNVIRFNIKLLERRSEVSKDINKRYDFITSKYIKNFENTQSTFEFLMIAKMREEELKCFKAHSLENDKIQCALEINQYVRDQFSDLKDFLERK